MTAVKDFNTIANYKWKYPPMIFNTVGGPIMQIVGLIYKHKKIEVINEFCFGVELIDYIDGQVVHWSPDCSKCFSFVNKQRKEIPYEKWLYSFCS